MSFIFNSTSQFELATYLKKCGLATFQVLKSPMSLMATVLDSTDVGHFHHCGKLYWTTLFPKNSGNWFFFFKVCQLTPLYYCEKQTKQNLRNGMLTLSSSLLAQDSNPHSPLPIKFGWRSQTFECNRDKKFRNIFQNVAPVTHVIKFTLKVVCRASRRAHVWTPVTL